MEFLLVRPTERCRLPHSAALGGAGARLCHGLRSAAWAPFSVNTSYLVKAAPLGGNSATALLMARHFSLSPRRDYVGTRNQGRRTEQGLSGNQQGQEPTPPGGI